jgi:hypothetical protein
LGVVDSVANHVPVMLDEGGTASAERGGWSHAAEFTGLVLDAGWAWAATAVVAGWWVSRHVRPATRMLRGALAGGLALGFATTSYCGADLLLNGSAWWRSRCDGASGSQPSSPPRWSHAVSADAVLWRPRPRRADVRQLGG